MASYLDHLMSQRELGKDVFIAPNATVIGKVKLGDGASVWYNAVIRGDTDWIKIGEQSNVQDCAVVHCDEGVPCTVGKHVVVGHSAILHGCTINDHCLIGMRATVMNKAVIGRGSIIGAHTLVTENVYIPEFSLVIGSPGKVVKQLPETMIQMIQMGADHYYHEAQKYLKGIEGDHA